jgi:mRNA-degrading endonuclease RelE of RelBE toxin-antitoxin system
LKWDPQALAEYKNLRRRLPPLKKEQLDERIDSLRDFPPARWYELRNQEDGIITFQLETDQFARVLGRFEDGVVYITHVELRSKGRGS